MTLKYLRINIFYALLKPFSSVVRKRRMGLFMKIMKPTSEMRILDLGGQPEIWESVEPVLNITCLNLPGIVKKNHQSHHNIIYLEGDACNMPDFQPGDFDLIFSNSVIEHVGDYEKRLQFANEVLRLSNKFWIQTPSKYFPIEAHCGMFFWWFYPKALRSYFIKKWAIKLPAWAEMVKTTTVISSSELRAILPGCTLKHEWIIFPKSIMAYSTNTNNKK